MESGQNYPTPDLNMTNMKVPFGSRLRVSNLQDPLLTVVLNTIFAQLVKHLSTVQSDFYLPFLPDMKTDITTLQQRRLQKTRISCCMIHVNSYNHQLVSKSWLYRQPIPPPGLAG